MAASDSRASWHPAFMPHSKSLNDTYPVRPVPHSKSSWNPAFMPNSNGLSVVDSAATDRDANVHISKGDNLNSSLGATSEDAPDNAEKGEESLGTNEGADAILERDNNSHPEIDNLRDALSSSLASPGGVEMDESPSYNIETEESLQDTSTDLLPTTERGDFPSVGPTNEFSQKSSGLFADDGPRGIDWGENDEVDPDWNINQATTDPFQAMNPLGRTNSFPQVPPSHLASAHFTNETIPHNQAEAIISQIEHEPSTLFDGDNGIDDGFFSKAADPSAFDEYNDQNSELALPDYGQSYGGDVVDLPGDDDRYGEGLPLVDSSENKDAQAADTTPSQLDDFLVEEGGEEEDFFAGIGISFVKGHSVQPSLERKSTMQVMDAMNFQPWAEAPQDRQGSTDLDWMNEIENPTTASATYSPPEQPRGFNDETQIESSNAHLPSEEDLAAKWKAALDGDDLLEDDDGFLEDDTPSAVDPAAFFGSDDEGFLEDDEDSSALNGDFAGQQSSQFSAPEATAQGLNDSNTRPSIKPKMDSQKNSRYLPQNLPGPTTPSIHTPYAPAAPLFTDLTRQTSASGYNAPISTHGLPQMTSFGGPPQPAKPEISKAQSFVNQAKTGYSSPYDLPMDVVKPKKRQSMQQMGSSYNGTAQPTPAAPPRSASMYSHGPESSFPVSSGLPPVNNQPTLRPTSSTSESSQPTSRVPHALKSKSSFFEELPILSKPRSAGRYTPQSQSPVGNLQATQFSQPSLPLQNPPSQSSIPPPIQASGQPGQGLVAPLRQSPYAAPHTLPNGGLGPVSVPTVASRYSPAPPQTQNNTPPPPVAQNRYAAAAPSSRPSSATYSNAPGPSPVFSHQPRTSSPLAHFEKSYDQRPVLSQNVNGFPDRRGSGGYDNVGRPSHLPATHEVDEQTVGGPQSNPSLTQTYAHSSTLARQPLSQQLYPPRRISSDYPQDVQLRSAGTFVPPQRSQTQSPSRSMAGQRSNISVAEPYQRPSSVHEPTSPRREQSVYAGITEIPKSRPRGFSQHLNYIAPVDGREHDPLQRWKGGPIFAWGVGGTVITSFPKEVPRYGMGQTQPMVVCSPGEVKVRSLRDILPLEQRLSSFPGPLKGKSKKKDIVTWLTSGIDILNKQNADLQNLPSSANEAKCQEERVLLWKTLRLFIDNDGILEGNPTVDDAVRAILSPSVDTDSSSTAPQYSTGAGLSGNVRASRLSIQAESIDPAALEELKKHLLRGEREKAVWEAVDKRLWAHALLISNTVSGDLYKQVAQEFVQKEVKSRGENTESLAALYAIFAGNMEESVDELVPVSARAGFQMVSTTGPAGPTKDALDGLNRWRETLGLILSNRSPDDSKAISALGNLLSGYGRTDAAHVCFIFARSHSVFGGVDDPSSNFVLVGSDHLREVHEFDKNLEAILLSEIYEYGLSLSASSNAPTSAAHLAVYKLQHATILAEYGQREKALQYCEATAASITSQTRRSPYHHALFVAALDDLSTRLKASPKDGSSSWISKPSIDKVSTSVWSKFNKFVAGDENDTGSGVVGDASAEVGPFARIAGGTPTISRSPSNADMYGSYGAAPAYTNGMQIPSSSRSTSRYAPGASYTPPGTMETQLSASYGSQQPHPFSTAPNLDGVLVQDRHGGSQAYLDHRQNSPSVASYAPHNLYSPADAPYSGSSFANSQPVTPAYEPTTSNARESPQSMGTYQNENSAQPLNSSFHSQTDENSYLPPEINSPYDSQNDADVSAPSQSMGGYEPPSYEPNSYEPTAMNDEPDSSTDTRPKKNFMDDDDDDFSTTRTKEKTKAEKDREADEAFKRAAEADAQKGKEAPASKKGWGLGWFGGAKKEAAPDISQPGKPIRAKLGEASSFFYDPELKRWVNKKAGKDEVSTPTGSTPPPPKAGPPRTPSGNGPPTSAPRPNLPPPGSQSSSRNVSGADTPSESPNLEHKGLFVPPTMSRTVSSGSVNGSGLGPPSGPPTRPSTAMSNASSIDDLLGPPTARKGTAKKAKKGRGYIDLMAKDGA